MDQQVPKMVSLVLLAVSSQRLKKCLSILDLKPYQGVKISHHCQRKWSKECQQTRKCASSWSKPSNPATFPQRCRIWSVALSAMPGSFDCLFVCISLCSQVVDLCREIGIHVDTRPWLEWSALGDSQDPCEVLPYNVLQAVLRYQDKAFDCWGSLPHFD